MAQYLHSAMKCIALACLLLIGAASSPAANKPDRIEWFRDLGLAKSVTGLVTGGGGLSGGGGGGGYLIR